jgi:type IV secretion system protein VirB9
MMKKAAIAFLLSLLICSAPAWADAGASDELNAKEVEALRLAAEWSDRPVKPIQTIGGKVVYVYGASLPTVVGSPLQISDIELEAGEIIHEILVGDTARWIVESGASSGNSSLPHVFVKPLEGGLQTSLVITTDKRAYHIKLISRSSGYTPYVGFIYQEDIKKQVMKDQQEYDRRTAEDVTGRTVALSGLDFNYRVDGRASWKPVQVYNDGKQTFIKLPDQSVRSGETPVLLAMKGSKEQLINYRFQDNTFVVDGLFEHLALITGVGGSQTRVDVRRGAK